MGRAGLRRWVMTFVIAAFLGTVAMATGWAAASEPKRLDTADVVGRYSVESPVGGAVWAFQPGGALFVVGPGDDVARGTWTEVETLGGFDATLDVDVTGQTLTILGALSPDGGAVALYVEASDAVTAGGTEPWPTQSLLIGERLVMASPESPAPSSPLDCLRPTWAEGDTVDWDRCDGADDPADPGADPTPEDG